MAGPFVSIEGLYLSREFSVYIVPTSAWDHWKGDDGILGPCRVKLSRKPSADI